MSYSRWSNSRWYTYWLASSQPENHNSATLCVDDFDKPCYIEAARIRKDVDSCVREVVDKQGGTSDEAEELKGYMLRFLADVDREYPRKTR